MRVQHRERFPLLASPWLQAAALAGLTLATWLARGIGDWPISWDPAYFTYVAQALLRGEPIYSTTFMAYPPLAPILGAAAMAVGSWADLPTYLAPRFLALPIGVASVLLMYAVTRRATGSGSAGLLAGIALAGVRLFATSHLATLEPKHLVVFFGLLAAAAAQRRRFLWAGAACGLAASAYQPALLLTAVYGVVALAAGGPRLRTALHFAAGVALGCLPALAVLAATSAWADFWLRAFSLTTSVRIPTLGGKPGQWLTIATRFYAAELPFFAAAGAGFVWHTWECVRLGPKPGLALWLDPRWAGMPLVLLSHAIWASLEFQGYPDMYVVLPGVAFFTGWLGWRVIEAMSARQASEPAAARARAIGVAATIAVALFVAFRDGPVKPPSITLTAQLAQLDRVAGSAESVLVALSAEEFYVLGERSSPLPFLRLPSIFVPFLPELGLRDCDAVLERMLATRPRAVVLRVLGLAGGCEGGLGQALTQRGWKQEQLAPVLSVYRRPLEAKTSSVSPGTASPAPLETAVSKPNVLLYVVDTLRADALSPYGSEEAHTPFLQQLADEGIVYELAFSSSSWTRPSVASILSGLPPDIHRVQQRRDHAPAGLASLPLALQAGGYQTGAIITNPNVGAYFGFDEGFDDFLELFEHEDANHIRGKAPRALADEVVRQAISWIDARRSPWFLFVLPTDPHRPYDPPPEFDLHGSAALAEEKGDDRAFKREIFWRAYLGEVAFTDHAFGTLMAHLRETGELERTVVVVTSDHGEHFAEHGQFGHGRSLYQPLLHVPLIVRLPGAALAGTRIASPVQGIDLKPTALALAGLDPAAGLGEFEGEVLPAANRAASKPAYAHVRLDGVHGEMVYDAPWKLIRPIQQTSKSARIAESLHQLERDPREQRNAGKRKPDVHARMQATLDERRQRSAQAAEAYARAAASAAGAETSAPGEMPDAVRRALEHLGYIEPTAEPSNETRRELQR